MLITIAYSLPFSVSTIVHCQLSHRMYCVNLLYYFDFKLSTRPFRERLVKERCSKSLYRTRRLRYRLYTNDRKPDVTR